MKTFELAVLEQALETLFNERSFSICQLDRIGELIGRNPSQHPDYKFLRALHCVHYADMRPEIRDQLQERVINTLRGGFLPAGVLARAILIEGADFVDVEDRPLLNRH